MESLNYENFLSIIKNTLNDQQLTELLYTCSIENIIKPRFEIISYIDISLENLFSSDENYKYNDVNKDNLMDEIQMWIFGPDSINLISLYNKIDVEFPPELDQIAMKYIQMDIETLIDQYLEMPDDDDEDGKITEFNAKAKKIQDELIVNWYNRKKSIRKKPDKLSLSLSDEVSGVSTEEELKTSYRESQSQQIFNVGFTPGISNVDANGKNIVSESDFDKKQSIQEFIQLRYIENAEGIRLKDIERFNSIFNQFETIMEIDIRELDKKDIINLWHGDSINGGGLIGVSNTRDIKLKIGNDHVSNSTSRLILQTYFAALYFKRNIEDIFKTVNNINKEQNSFETYTKQVQPAHIYTKDKLPSSDIKNVLNSLITYSNFSQNHTFIRNRWKYMQNPDINYEKLYKFIDDYYGENYLLTIKTFVALFKQTNKKQNTTIKDVVDYLFKNLNSSRGLPKKIIKRRLEENIEYNLEYPSD